MDYKWLNNRHFGYLETKITNFKILGTHLGTTLGHCRLILETETEPGTKSCFHYLCCHHHNPPSPNIYPRHFPRKPGVAKIKSVNNSYVIKQGTRCGHTATRSCLIDLTYLLTILFYIIKLTPPQMWFNSTFPLLLLN